MDLSKLLGLKLPEVSDSGEKIEEKTRRKWRGWVFFYYLLAIMIFVVFLVAFFLSPGLMAGIEISFARLSLVVFLLIMAQTRHTIARKKKLILANGKFEKLLY